ncbi:MAG: transcriptional repressor LexA [Ignavibacteriales bacterium]|nr:transcriptional repressor LexA [Ignavibacteriales bacterium]
MMKDQLTDRQQAILNFIQQFAEANGFPPTYREIGKHFNISSTFGVKRHVDALAKKGHLTNESKTSRTISIIDEGLNKSGHALDNMLGLPIVGRVAAGYPVLAEENIEGNMMIDATLVNNKVGCFGLKVSGDSMVNAGILEGDLVIVSPQKNAVNGDIVVALLHDEATMKRFEIKENKIYLVPENEKYRPIEVDNVEEFSIIGKVISVFRTYN